MPPFCLPGGRGASAIHLRGASPSAARLAAPWSNARRGRDAAGLGPDDTLGFAVDVMPAIPLGTGHRRDADSCLLSGWARSAQRWPHSHAVTGCRISCTVSYTVRLTLGNYPLISIY